MGLNLQGFYIENNFKFDKKLAYGIYRNRVLSVLESSTYIQVTITFNQQLDQNIGQTLSNKMGELKAQYKILRNAITTNIYLELQIYKSADINDSFVPLLDKVIDNLDALNLQTCEICPLCGRALSTVDPFIRIRNTVLQGHEECVSQLLDQSNKINKSFDSKADKSTLKATLIGFLAMLLVIGIQTALCFTPIDVFLSILTGTIFLLVARLACNKTKTFMGKNALIIFAIMSIVVVLSTTYITSAITLHKYFEPLMEVSLGDVFKNYFIYIGQYFNEIGKSAIIDLVLNLAFTGVNIFVYFRSFLSAKNQIKRLS